MSTLNSSGSGALTQIIAQGALDAYLSQNATFTFWKVRYNKHTNFAMESIGQPFNTAVHFGAEAQITLNRNGDLIYYMYIVIDLPGITAQARLGDESSGGAVFGSHCSAPCNPCQRNDEMAYAEYLGDGFSEASSDAKANMLAAAMSIFVVVYMYMVHPVGKLHFSFEIK